MYQPTRYHYGKRKSIGSILLLILLICSFSLFAQQKGTVIGRLTDADSGEPLIGANVILVGTFQGSSTGPDGTFSFEADPGDYTLRATYIGYVIEDQKVTVVAGKTVTVNFQISQGAVSLGGILVTGTRSKGRTAMESAVPIDAFEAKVIERQGNGDLTETLKNIVPSYTATPLTGDGAAFVRPTSLRGLPPDDILVLTNSKRRHRSSLISHFGAAMNVGAQAVDVGMIPSIAVKRLEVLRDGASAQYGSDAIAGVMNFILKDNSKGVEVQATTSSWFNAPNGRGHESDTKVGINVGLPISNNGFLNISGEYSDNPELSRGIQHASAAEGYKGWSPAVENDVDKWDPAMNWGRPASNGFRSAWNAGIKMGNNAEVYSFGNFADTYGNYSFFYRAPGRTGALTPIPIDPTDPSKGNFSFGDQFPLGFTPRLEGDQVDFSGIMGIKGHLDNGLIYDLSASYGTNRISYTLNGSLNLSYGPESPFVFDIGDLQQSETNYNIDFAYPVSQDVNVAFGAEYRDEVYHMFEGQKESWSPGPWAKVFLLTDPETGEKYTAPGLTANGMRGTSRTEAGVFDRQNTAVYVDAEWDVTEALLVQAAGRFEDFSDFGNTTNGKLAARLNLTEQFVLRGAVSSGFRAPTPGQSNVTTIVTSFDGVTGTQVQEGTVRPDDPLAVALGGKALVPEDAFNVSFGVTARPTNNLNLTVDAYQIDVDSRIIKSRSLPVTGNPEFSELAFYTNALDTRTKGLDVVAVFNLNRGYQTSTDVSIAYNYNKTEVTKQRQVGGLNPVSDDLITNIEENLPKSRANVTVVQGITNQFSFMARGNYYGSTVDERGTKEEVGAEILIDAELRYRLNNNVSLIGGANNLLNNYPDEISTRLSQGMPYPRRTPIGYNGGMMYLRAEYKF